jgi:YD repeat-containing protein
VGSSVAITALTNHYDSTGRIDWVEDGKGNRSGYSYDANNRLSQFYFPSAAAPHTVNAADNEQYSYDTFGNLIHERLRDGSGVSLTYDPMERLSSRTNASGDGTVRYAYDLVGDVLGIGYGSPSSPALSFTWDALGRKLSETSYGHTLSSQYDAAGNRTRLTYPDGNYIAYSYDLLNRMYRVQQNGGTVLAQYAYDDLGRVAGISRSNGAATTASYGAYSQNWSLTQDLASSGLDVTFGLGYSAAGQLSDRSISNSAYRYGVGASATTNYTANGLNQYAAVGGTAYSYDARGNLTSDGVRQFTYDGDNRLVQATNGTVGASGQWGSATWNSFQWSARPVVPGNWGSATWGAFQWTGPATTYLAYDPAGRLHQTAGPAGTAQYVYDGEALAVEYDVSGNILRRYVPGQGPGIAALAAHRRAGQRHRHIRCFRQWHGLRLQCDGRADRLGQRGRRSRVPLHRPGGAAAGPTDVLQGPDVRPRPGPLPADRSGGLQPGPQSLRLCRQQLSQCHRSEWDGWEQSLLHYAG